MSGTLLDNLDLLAASVGGVARLRELVLSLAVRGRLVPQDPSDEPASELLKRIRAEKDRLIKEGKIKRDKPLHEIADDEKPYELPESWEWIRLTDAYYSISPSSNKLPSSLIGDSGQFPVVDQGKMYVAGYTNDAELVIHLPGPVIVFGDHTKEIKYVDFNFVAGADGTKILRPLLQNERYFYWYVRSLRLESRGYARHFKVLNDNLYALPPLAEQSRIVAKVEELMALCDRLEAEQGHAARVQGHWVDAALDQFAESADTNEFRRHWQHLAAHFDTLFTTPESIDRLDATLLQLAVRGKLVPQDPNDEPASELLKQIRAEKDWLIKEGKIKRDKPLPPVADDEKPYGLPTGWEWVRFGDVTDITSGVTLGRKTHIKTPVHLPYLRVANVQRWHLVLRDIKEVIVDESEIDRFRLRDGDLLITEGGDWDKVGRTCIWRNQIETCLHQNHVFKVRGVFPDWNPQWGEMYLNSADARRYFASSAKQTTNLASINMTQLKNCAFPLPPLAEQSHIVAQVEKLLSLTASLKARLAAAQTKQAHLAEALIAELTTATPSEPNAEERFAKRAQRGHGREAEGLALLEKAAGQ